jgi:N-acetylneuraminic acid mutarotase
MLIGRELLGVGVVNNILYAIGGSTDGSNNLSTVETYDTVSDTWTTATSMPTAMPTARGGLAVGVNDGILYAVGGQLPDIVVGSPVPKTLEAYNPAMNSWTTLDPMPTGRTLLAADVVNGILYAVGGDDQGTVETFTPPTP